MAEVELDEVDRQILEILHEDGRASYKDIADRLGLTGNTVRRRMDELREAGAIRKFTVLTDPEKLGYQTVAFGLDVEAGRTEDIAEELAAHECVYKLWILSGTHNIIFDARFEENSQFHEFVHETIHDIEGIANYESAVVTRHLLNDGSIILSDGVDDLPETAEEVSPAEE